MAFQLSELDNSYIKEGGGNVKVNEAIIILKCALHHLEESMNMICVMMKMRIRNICQSLKK